VGVGALNTSGLTDKRLPPSQPSPSQGEGANTRRRSAKSWLALTALFMFTSLIAWPINHQAIDWQPALALTQPWRAFTAALIHYSPMHLAANLVGAVLVGIFGWAAQAPRRMTIAWLIAWPLTQFGLLVQPSLLHYGGLSGVLHAGVIVVCVHLMFQGTTAQRRVGWATLLVVIAKVLMETPWQGPLSYPAEWDIAVAPMAHATGVIAGLLMGLLCAVLGRGAQKR
jgi:rhomboid family GlyGly-CTERM serine protease